MRRLIISLSMMLIAGELFSQALNIGYVHPTGAAAGSTVEVTVGGQNMTRVDGVRISGDGITGEIIPDTSPKPKKRGRRKISDEDNLQLDQKVKIRLTIDKSATPGIRDFRLTTPTGSSNRIFFEVGQLRDYVEQEPNGTFEEANTIGSLPVTVSGQVMKGERDFFRFEAQKGQSLVIQVKARRFVPYLADAVPGWFQPVLAMFDKDGNEVAYCDDYNGNPDPVILFDVPMNGEYTISIRDAIYRGREDFVYRISIGELPFIKHISPIGAVEGKKTKVKLYGVNLPKQEITFKGVRDDMGLRPNIQVKNKGILSNEIPFDVSNDTEVKEDRSLGNSAKDAVPIFLDQLPMLINGAIETPFDQDWFYIDIPRAQPLIAEVVSRTIGSPLDAKISIFDSKLRKIGEEDDTENAALGLLMHHADPTLIHRIPRPGRYYIRVIDAQNRGGEEFQYRLKVFKPTPDFDLNIAPSSINLNRGGSAYFDVFINRKYMFRDPVKLIAEGLPSGYKLSYNILDRGDKKLRMTITAPKDASLGPIKFSLRGEAHVNGHNIVRYARPVEAMTQAFYITHLIPTDDFSVNIAPEQPFTLEVVTNGKPIQLSEKGPVPITVRIHRKEGYNEPVQLMMRQAGAGLKLVSSVRMEPGQETAELMIMCRSWRPNKLMPLIIQGTVKGVTVSRVKGQARNSVNASVMVLSPAVTVKAPAAAPPKAKKKR